MSTCPICSSADPMKPFDVYNAVLDQHEPCRNTFHPPQAFTPLGGKLKQSCGPHCGIRDGMEGHCICGDCHAGDLPLGLKKLSSLDGKSVKGVRPT